VRSATPESAKSGTPSACGPPVPLGLRERKKAQTREAILDAAITLYERNGYDATTVEEIAAEANVSPRTFFRYFDTKLETIMEQSEAEVGEFQRLVRERPPEESALEAVHHVVRQKLVVEMLDEGTRLARELRVVMSTASLRSSAQEHLREHQDSLVPVLAERLGVAPDAVAAHVMAAVITTTVWTVFERWAAEGGDPDRLAPLMDEAFAFLANPK
jgi:AcrR family transcriptional regulator